MVYLDAVEMRQIIDFRLSFMAILVLCLRLFLPLRGPYRQSEQKQNGINLNSLSRFGLDARKCG